MKKIRIILLALIIFMNTIFSTGCWSYREVDEFSIVAGVAIDKDINNKYQLTVEIIQIGSGKESKIESKIISSEGKTMFDAVRNLISLSGKKLYWNHAKVIILSKEIAREGVTKVIEWFTRDAATREEMNLLISQEDTAKEIYVGQGNTEEIKSFTLDKIINNQVSLSKAPQTDILKYNIESKTKGLSPIIPSVNLKEVKGKIIPEVMGTAIIKQDKLLDFINGEETKDLIFIRNEVKGGILIEEIQIEDAPTLVSLEIFKNKTKVKPVVDGKEIKINLNIETSVAIGEINGTGNPIDDDGRKGLEQSAENTLKKRVEYLIKKMQTEYDEDVFGFGAKLQEEKNQVWDSVGDNWGKIFAGLEVSVNTRVNIKNSAILSKSIKEGD